MEEQSHIRVARKAGLIEWNKVHLDGNRNLKEHTENTWKEGEGKRRNKIFSLRAKSIEHVEIRRHWWEWPRIMLQDEVIWFYFSKELIKDQFQLHNIKSLDIVRNCLTTSQGKKNVEKLKSVSFLRPVRELKTLGKQSPWNPESGASMEIQKPRSTSKEQSHKNQPLVRTVKW